MDERTQADGPKCISCGKYTQRIGSFSACANAYCERYAMPVNNDGMTDGEAAAAAIAPPVPDEDATGYNAREAFERTMLEGGHTRFGYARND